MIRVALYQPEIPPNTGNVMRLCANAGCELHLIHPLGFTLEESQLRRAGLDYRDMINVRQHSDYKAFLAAMGSARIFAFTTHAQRHFGEVPFEDGDVLLFGPESRGLPVELREALGAERCLRLPMRPGNRSLNLSNAVAVAVFEAWRQTGYEGGA